MTSGDFTLIWGFCLCIGEGINPPKNNADDEGDGIPKPFADAKIKKWYAVYDTNRRRALATEDIAIFSGDHGAPTLSEPASETPPLSSSGCCYSPHGLEFRDGSYLWFKNSPVRYGIRLLRETNLDYDVVGFLDLIEPDPRPSQNSALFIDAVLSSAAAGPILTYDQGYLGFDPRLKGFMQVKLWADGSGYSRLNFINRHRQGDPGRDFMIESGYTISRVTIKQEPNTATFAINPDKSDETIEFDDPVIPITEHGGVVYIGYDPNPDEDSGGREYFEGILYTLIFDPSYNCGGCPGITGQVWTEPMSGQEDS